MSKARELARELQKDLYEYPYEQLGKRFHKLCDAVLSEPEPDLKGWIEDSSTKGKRRLIHLYHDVVYVEEIDNIVMRYFEESQIELSITFDQLKQLIARAS